MTPPEPEACPYPFPEVPQLGLAPEYGRFRRSGALGRVRMPFGGPAWLATRLADVKTVLADPSFSRAAALHQDVPRTTPDPENAPTILVADAPDHTRLRRVVAGEFTARRTERLRPAVRAAMARLVDRVVEQGPPAEFVGDVAVPLALSGISELFGVPGEDREDFQALAGQATGVADAGPDGFAAAARELAGYLTELAGRRRARPAGDLMSVLVSACDTGLLAEDELIALAGNVISGGIETTAGQLSGHVFTLLSRRDRWDQLVAAPDLVGSAVEELLRWTPLGLVTFCRVATRDVTIGRITVRAGQAVVTQPAAANRDEDAFEHAGELDLARERNPHIAFGHGAHRCLGAPLARVELQEGLAALVRGLPCLRLAVPADEVPFKSGRLLRGPRALPLAW